MTPEEVQILFTEDEAITVDKAIEFYRQHLDYARVETIHDDVADQRILAELRRAMTIKSKVRKATQR